MAYWAIPQVVAGFHHVLLLTAGRSWGFQIDQVFSIHGTIRGRAGGLCKLVAMAVALADCSGQLRWSGVVRLVYNGLVLIEVGRGEIDLVGFLWTLNSSKPMCNDMFLEWSR